MLSSSEPPFGLLEQSLLILVDIDPDLWSDNSDYLENKVKYRCVVGKLSYLFVTRPYILYAVGWLVHWWMNSDPFIGMLPAKYWDALRLKRYRHLRVESYVDVDCAGLQRYRKWPFWFVPILVSTLSYGGARCILCWQDLVQKLNIGIWLLQKVSFYVGRIYWKNLSLWV